MASSAFSVRMSATCSATTTSTMNLSALVTSYIRRRSRCIQLDTEDRIPELRQAHGIGYCNITKCCSKVCPEHITITDNAIIPLKERVVDEFYDPLGWLWKRLRPKG